MDLTPYYGFAEDAVHFHRSLPRRARAVRRRRPSALQALVRRVLLSSSTARSRAASAASSSTTSTSGGFDRCFALTRSVGDHFLAAYLPILERRRQHALRRARARFPGLPARALRRVQPGLGSRHAVRPAIERPHRVDPDVAAADRQMALRLAARAGSPEARALHRLPDRQGLAGSMDDPGRAALPGATRPAAPTTPSSSRRGSVRRAVYQGKLLRRAPGPRPPARRRRGDARVHRASGRGAR